MKFSGLIKISLLVCWFIAPLCCAANEPAEALFAKANALYAKAKYTDALNTYRKLAEDGYQSAAIYFNMGNASYKNGDLASAILYYEKAHKLSPGDEDINFNLKYANLKTTDKVEEAPEFFLNKWWKGIILSFSLKALSVWSIIFVLAASGILILYFFAEAVAIKKTAFYTAVALFLVGAGAIFVANRQLNYFDDHRQAIIFSGSVNVKNGPVDQSGTLFVLHDGTKVDVLENNNEWLKIRLANGSEGWIRQSAAKEI